MARSIGWPLICCYVGLVSSIAATGDFPWQSMAELCLGAGERETVSGEQEAVRSNKPHRNLKAWQKSMDLVVDVYGVTRKFPPEESYGLTSQLRRAAVSAPSNIAEGAAGRTQQQFSNFLSNAIGSLNEIDTQLELALLLGYVTRVDYNSLCQALDECLALTFGLRKSLNKR